MTSVLQELEPKEIWGHFEALSRIPRGSGNEAGAREYVLAHAARLGLEATQDAVGNVIVRKPARAGREQAATAVLQAHLDMVCEKDESATHDFERDAIQMVRDGNWLKAKGTTLGADNGIGVAAALAVMGSKNVAHGPLEFLFTIDEEDGLTGATKFAGGLLKSKYFLNLDNEDQGTLCIGCAGGINTTAHRKLARHAAGSGSSWRIKVSGLKGGHSGVDIHLGRGNALRILGQVLHTTIDKIHPEIADIRGGNKYNAIPREASAIVLLDAAHEQKLTSIIAAAEAEAKAEIGSFDPDIRITAERVERPAQVLDADDTRRIVDVLIALPSGVLAMSPDIPGLVQTSTNLAIVTTDDKQVKIGTSQRSPIESGKMGAVRLVATIFRMAGFDLEYNASYPGWKPEPASELVRKLQNAHEEVFGQPAKLVAMHAGLECGVIGENYPGMQMISFGPQIENPHSPSERVDISSVAEFWRYLTVALERL